MSDSTTPPLWLQVPEPQNLVKLYGTALDVPAFGGRLEVDWSQIADAGTALGGGNSAPIAPWRGIGQAKTGF